MKNSFLRFTTISILLLLVKFVLLNFLKFVIEDLKLRSNILFVLLFFLGFLGNKWSFKYKIRDKKVIITLIHFLIINLILRFLEYLTYLFFIFSFQLEENISLLVTLSISFVIKYFVFKKFFKN